MFCDCLECNSMCPAGDTGTFDVIGFTIDNVNLGGQIDKLIYLK